MKRATSASVVQLGLLQSVCSAHPPANLRKTLALAERAARQGAQIICTQELFCSQYFCQSEDHENFKLAEPIPGVVISADGRPEMVAEVHGAGLDYLAKPVKPAALRALLSRHLPL